MLNFEILCETHRTDLEREAARDRLAVEASCRQTLRGSVSRILRTLADRLERTYASPRTSKAAW
jgi:hypothetical protein